MPDFSAGVLDIAKAMMPTIFKTKATVNPQLNLTPVTQDAVLRNQTATVTQVREAAGNKCIGLRAIYNILDDTSAPADSSSPISSACELTGGNTMSQASQDYTLNYFQKEEILLNSQDCDNIESFAERLAFLLPSHMTLMAQQFNRHVISEIEANKSVAAAPLPDNVTIPASTEYTITGAEYWTQDGAADTIMIFDQLAALKGLPRNYMILAGKALQIPRNLSRYQAANDDQRSYQLIFGTKDMFYNDIDFLDVVVGAEVVYLVDPNIFLTYFNSEFPAQPVATNDENNTMHFSIPFQYFDMYQDGMEQLRSIVFANNGNLEEARLDVSYQIKCNNTITKFGKKSYDHRWELDLGAMFDFIPSTDTGRTGIIRVDKVL